MPVSRGAEESAHGRVLEGLRVVDLSIGIAGAVTTMLLSDYGADVVKVEPPDGDPFRTTAGYTVWNRGKKSVALDIASGEGRASVGQLLVAADVLVESFAPGQADGMGFSYPALQAAHPRLVHCSITGYGHEGSMRNRPAEDGLVQARSALQNEQPGLRPGPVYLHVPLPSMGAALLASNAIAAALHARAVTGRGQWVTTSLMQGALAWDTQLRKRAEHPTAGLMNRWMFKELGPTPCFEASDGLWFHPMPWGVPVALAHVGLDPDSLPVSKLDSDDFEEKSAYFASLREVYRQRPRQEWLALFLEHDLPCQAVCPAEHAFEHPQMIHNRAVTELDIPGVGPVRQFGHAYRLERHDNLLQGPPPEIGQHTKEVLARGPAAATEPVTGAASLRYALDGIRVLDFGTALAGPFGAMVLGDFGADVIKVDPVDRAGSEADSTYAGCQRGKRSIAIDLKSTEGQEIVRTLISSADVIHYNLRTGVAERLGFGYEQAKAINPGIIFCHVTGYGNTGPYALLPGVDQMGQALCGLEYEQGGTPNGGHPTWYRFGMCDATTGFLSSLAVLQALYHRDRTGQGQAVEVDILSSAMLLASDAFIGPDDLPTRAHLDRDQTGFGPLHRLYRTKAGWLCVVARTDADWNALCHGLGLPRLLDDARFATSAARHDHAEELSAVLGERFQIGTAAAWFDILDQHGVPCEIASESWQDDWVDDPDAISNGWVTNYRHPVWGKFEQPGRLFELSDTPGHIAGPPPLIGQHTREILRAIDYSEEQVEKLRATGVVAW